MLHSISILWQVFGRYRWHVIALAVFGVLSALLEGIGINAVIPLVSFFNGGPDANATSFFTNAIQSLFAFFGLPFTFRYLLGFILGLFALRAVAMVVFGYIRGWIGADFLGKESEDIFSRTLLTSWPFLLRQRIGSMHNTLVRDIQNTGGLLSVLAQVVQSFTGFFAYLAVAVSIEPEMTVYTLAGGAIVLIILRPLFRRTRSISTEAAQVEKRFSQFLTEHIIGMKAIKAAGAETQAIADGSAHIRRLRALSIGQAFVRSLSTSLFQPAGILLIVVLFTVMYNAPGFSIISFAATLYLIQKIFTYLESGQNALVGITENLPYAENITGFKRLLAEHREEQASDGAPFAFSDRISFQDVGFSYDGEHKVLSKVSFTVKRGETVGLIGPSGSGKTSVADLILRLFAPTEGTIRVDGAEIGSISLADWRRHIGYVSQDVFLLNSSIADNIRFYKSDLSQEDVERAAKLANIHDFIGTLPEGYGSITGDRGVMLSGGQRQRIALARALAGKPDILVLDEATSALDLESERQVQEAIDGLHGSVTVIVIAHRLSTIERADRIVALTSGKVLEEGTPDELRKDQKSYFARHAGSEKS